MAPDDVVPDDRARDIDRRLPRSAPSRGAAISAGLAAIALLAVGACKRTDDAPPAAGDPGARPPDAIAAPARSRLVPHRPLLDEVSRAELDASGLLIDFGTPDQHKYTRGGWRSGWGRTGRDHDTTSVALADRQGFLELAAPQAPPAAIVVRARSRTPGQTLSFHVAGRELGQAKLGGDWSVVHVALRPGALPREGRFRLEVRAGAGDRPELDWLWLATGAGQPGLGPRIQPLSIAGTTRRALVAPAARSYAFYLSPPPHSRLVVDLGAARHAEFVVTATGDGGARTELLRATVDGGWSEKVIPLDALAGRAVRLELATMAHDGEAGWGEPELMLDAAVAPAPAPASAPPRNVIFVLMDTARADGYGPFGGPDRVAKTPSYDALAARSTVFTGAYDNENWTKPSVATTLSGLYPSTHDTKKDESKLPAGVELISEHLRAAGFATAAFIANGFISDHFGFNQGWDSFKNYIREARPSDAEYVFGDALAWQAAHTRRAPNQPYFLYLQTIDPHVPYRDKPAFTRLYFPGDYHGPLGKAIEAEDQIKLSTHKLKATPTDLAWLRALYWGEVSYHDDELGKFVQALEARHALDDTLLVVTNDHGEELGDRGRFGHGHQVFEELIRAPLLIHYPPLFPAGAVIPDIVEHVDLAPTIVDALGRDPLKNADGVSFLPLVRGRPGLLPRYAMTEFLDGRRVLRVGHWKLIARADGAGDVFDLAADPGEQHALGAAAPIARQLCEIYLGEALATPSKTARMQGLGVRRRFHAGTAAITPQMRRELEALGYLGAAPRADDDKNGGTHGAASK